MVGVKKLVSGAWAKLEASVTGAGPGGGAPAAKKPWTSTTSSPGAWNAFASGSTSTPPPAFSGHTVGSGNPGQKTTLVDVRAGAEPKSRPLPPAAMVFDKPSSVTSTTVRFEIGGYGGKEIKPGEQWLFEVPEQFRDTPIRTAILAHRKDDKYAHTYQGERDQEGAYNLVTARKTGTDEWVTWSDMYGSKKFAERRSAGDPENENLHDWVAAVGRQNVDLLSVKNVGQGKHAIANVHLLEIEFFPPGKRAGVQEEIFTPGTQFADLDEGRTKPRFGGGMGSSLGSETLKTKGLYPDAVVLGGYGPGGAKPDPQKAYLSGGRLRIKLPPGKKIGSVEIACGDTEFDKSRPTEQQRNKDGHYGKLGWAKLHARIRHGDTGKTSKDFMVNVNVPPAGVLSGGPTDAGYVTKPGDEIEIESRGHQSWVMGYRIQFVE